MWPNLGINLPAGAAVSVAAAQANAAMFGARYYIRCETCNCDGHKPHPDQDKIDSAAELDRMARQQTWKHTVTFDGTSIVDRWNGMDANPIKYGFRRPNKATNLK